jgi:hypothetical protein
MNLLSSKKGKTSKKPLMVLVQMQKKPMDIAPKNSKKRCRGSKNLGKCWPAD